MAGSMTTFTITQQADKDFLINMSAVQQKLALSNAKVLTLTARLTTATENRDTVGTRLRGLFSSHSAGFDNNAPATITDCAFGVDENDQDNILHLYLNADAAAARANPPVGEIIV